MRPGFVRWMRTAVVQLLWLLGAGTAHAVSVGDDLSNIELPGISAQQRAVLRGTVVYLDFWASWCGPCRQSFPWMNEMQAKYAARGLQIVAMNLDAKNDDAQHFLAEVPVHFALGFDPRADSARRLDIKGMPTSILIGADGKVLAVHRGFRIDDRSQLEADLAHALESRRLHAAVLPAATVARD